MDQTEWTTFLTVGAACCDVFVWIGVWRDLIRYWVLSSKEVEGNKYYSQRQHRGNVGEGQLHLKEDNISQFSEYETGARDLIDHIRAAYNRQIAV
jgi:hypothetical protein